MKRLENITLDAVRRYLCASRWEEFPNLWDDVFVYRRPEEENSFAEILLPKKRNERFNAFILDAAREAAEFESVSVDDVLFKWRNPAVDRVRLRMISKKTDFGSTPLNHFQTFVAGMFDALRAAVKDVVNPAPYHKRLGSAEISELTNSAEFGQTERGSFVVNIFVPVSEAKEGDVFNEARNNVFRRGLEHLTTTLQGAANAVETGEADRFLDGEKGRAASGNLFGAVESARPDEETDIEISVDWSPLVAVTPSVPSEVYLKKEYSESFRRWERARRPKTKDSLRREFVGQVVELAGDQRDDERPFGNVIFLVFDEERNFEARASLGADEYETALDCRRFNKCVAFAAERVYCKSKATLESIENLRGVERGEKTSSGK